MLCQAVGIYQVTPEEGFYSLYPSLAITDFSKFSLTFGQVFKADFSGVSISNFIAILFAFLLGMVILVGVALRLADLLLAVGVLVDLGIDLVLCHGYDLLLI